MHKEQHYAECISHQQFTISSKSVRKNCKCEGHGKVLRPQKFTERPKNCGTAEEDPFLNSQ